MVYPEPQNILTLKAQSVAEDLFFVTLKDLASIFRCFGKEPNYRIIGGQSLSLHVQRLGLPPHLLRETQDADIGIEKSVIVINGDELINALTDHGYTRDSGNSFHRQIDDLPSVLQSHTFETSHMAKIDVLIPSATSHARSSVKVGNFAITEVPGLACALNAPAVTISVRATRLNGEIIATSVQIPDERSALIMKALVTEKRNENKDIIDLWRCLEICHAATVVLKPFYDNDKDAKQAIDIILRIFGDKSTHGMRIISRISEHPKLSTRIRALTRSVIGPWA